MNILLLGSGGREYAFAYHMKKSDLCDRLYVAPGNGGTAEIATNIQMDILDSKAIIQFCVEHQIDMVVIGPEQPLVVGVVDDIRTEERLKHCVVVGPGGSGARLEGSKSYAKDFMNQYGIPTAAFREFDQTQKQKGLDYLRDHSYPVVLKADGLAAGKGVLICPDYESAEKEFVDMLDGKFGEASSKIVVEEFLTGIEFSVFVAFDGNEYKVLPVAKDYKRIGEGDTGLNTGGMGSVSPVSFVDDALMLAVRQDIILPTLHGIRDRGLYYRGFIFIGLIQTDSGPQVIEYNCRMGDPETQSVWARLNIDSVEFFKCIGNGTLGTFDIEIKPESATTVVLASDGYPESYEKNKEITIPEMPANVISHHAGTKLENGRFYTNGGRVIAVTALAENAKESTQDANDAADMIKYEGKYYRHDIGQDLMKLS